MVNQQNQIETLKQIWYFDRVFSSSVILDFDKNKDRTLDKEELEAISSIIKESLAEFYFFQSVKIDGKPFALSVPDRLHADFTNGQLILHFASKPSKPLFMEPGRLYQFTLYDPSFYVAVNFPNNHDISLQHLPAFCTIKFERPNEDSIFSQNQLDQTETFFENPETASDMAYTLAPKFEVSCKK